MAYYSICFLNNLNIIEAKELKEQNARNYKVFIPISNILDLSRILGLNNFNLDPTFQESLGFINRTPQAS